MNTKKFYTFLILVVALLGVLTSIVTYKLGLKHGMEQNRILQRIQPSLNGNKLPPTTRIEP